MTVIVVMLMLHVAVLLVMAVLVPMSVVHVRQGNVWPVEQRSVVIVIVMMR